MEIDSELFPQGKIDNPALEEYATLVWENRKYRRVNKMDLARLITGEPRGDSVLAKALQNNFRTYQANGRIAKVPRSQG